MSGPQQEQGSQQPSEDESLVARIRAAVGLAVHEAPDDAHLLDAVRGFIDAFEYWYIRVMQGAVPKYRALLIARINPFMRRIELDGLDADAAAQRLVLDYNSRNFVTAGGWAIEEMAVRMGHDAQKSSAEGIDIQRLDSSSGDYHLYVLKSGLVTRNSDIMKALKRNSRQAERLLLQGRGTGNVHAHYAIAAGRTRTTFEDGINRPSSEQFWADMTGLEPARASRLALEVAAEAGRLVRRDASVHLLALQHLIAHYIRTDDGTNAVDWEFLIRRNMSPKSNWAAEDGIRHARAKAGLVATGYAVDGSLDAEPAAEPGEVDDELEPETLAEILEDDDTVDA